MVTPMPAALPPDLHRRGHRGGTILPHRSIRSLRLPPGRLLAGALLAAAFTVALLRLQPWVARAWSNVLLWWMRGLALPGDFTPAVGGGEVATLAVPGLELRLRGLTGLAVLGHAVALVLLWWLPARLPDAARPLTFLLRFVALTHGAALLFFVLWPASFPHSVRSHVGSGLRQAWMLMLLTPWLHLATFYIFPVAWWHRVLLTLLTLLFVLVLTPLQYACHAALVVLLGLVAMPVLHLLGGVMLPILGFVALYGWGMSWRRPALDLA